MRAREIACVMMMMILAAGAAVAEDTSPQPQEIIGRMIEAAGGQEAFSQLGLLRLRLDEEETTSDGNSHKSVIKAYVGTTDLDTFRLEMPPNLVLARNGDSGWAVFRGQLDRRPSTPAMAKGTIHARLLPVLFPYVLAMKEIQVLELREGKFDQQPAWMLQIRFPDEFFATPIMNTTWSIFVAKKDYNFLGASFQPPKDLDEAGAEGVRYRYLKYQDVGKIKLPSQLIMEGLFENGLENGHIRIVNITAKVEGWDATLFLDPEQLRKLEEQEEAGFATEE